MHKNWMHHKNENKDSLEKLWNISEGYKGDYQPNVEKGLVRLKARIAQDKTMPSTAKIIPISNKKWIGRIAASIVFLIACGFLFNLFINNTPDLQQIVTTDALMEAIQLPDGSTVWVNKHSQLTFPTSFDGTTRKVQLVGEAFFKITKNVEKPFIVETPDGVIKVLGTAFNVRAYDKELMTTIEVEEGSVVFQINDSKLEKTLKANDKVIYNRTDATLSAIQPLDWEDTAWKATQLKFEDEPIENIIGYLTDNFTIKVDFDKEAIGNCPLNVTRVDNQPESILKQIDSAFPLIKLKQVHSNLYELRGSCE